MNQPQITLGHVSWSPDFKAAPLPIALLGGVSLSGAPPCSAWTQTPPTETGIYWLWMGDEDSGPIPVQVYDDGLGNAWVAPGQYGWNRHQTMDELANSWWAPCEPPTLPNVLLYDK